MRGQDRYCCSNHVMTGSCANGRGIRRVQIEERVLAGLKARLMVPEAAPEAMKAYAEETNRLNRERRASGATDRAELAEIEKRTASMIAAIEEGGYVRGMSDRLRELEARQDEIAERLAEAADAIRGLIERIVLTPGEKRGEMYAALHGDLGTILEWAGNGRGKGRKALPNRECRSRW